MLELITSYLFRYQKCPLPSVGSLHLVASPAMLLHGENKIAAPHYSIEFSTTEFPAEELVQFIAEEKKVSTELAALQLDDYCMRLRSMAANETSSLPDAGNFFVDADGILGFMPKEISSLYLPEVNAERVIHPNDRHAMLVGDTETNTGLMSELLTIPDAPKKSRWWIWAIVLLAVAGIAFIIYFNDANRNANMGNAQPVSPAKEAPTYKSPN